MSHARTPASGPSRQALRVWILRRQPGAPAGGRAPKFRIPNHPPAQRTPSSWAGCALPGAARMTVAAVHKALAGSWRGAAWARGFALGLRALEKSVRPPLSPSEACFPCG